jgi:hypothetical protein
VLELVSEQPWDVTVFRYASLTVGEDDQRTLTEMGLDPDDKRQFLQILGALGYLDTLDTLCDRPFVPPVGPPYFSSRFSDGSWRVFYSALEIDTAEAEVIHHQRRNLLPTARPRPVYFRRFVCRFAGLAKDVRPLCPTHTFLCDPSEISYPQCQAVGAEAVAESLDGLLSLSARRPGGNTLPVFRRAAISTPQDLGLKIFQVDPGTGDSQITDAS